MKEGSHGSGTVDKAALDTVNKTALDHARAMVIQASDIRMKNFNFFLIIMGVIITAYANVNRDAARLGLGAVGMLVSIAFLLLDIRGRELLDAAQKELALRESKLGIAIWAVLLKKRAGKFTKKAISHTFVYRAIYVLGIMLSLILAIGSKIYSSTP